MHLGEYLKTCTCTWTIAMGQWSGRCILQLQERGLSFVALLIQKLPSNTLCLLARWTSFPICHHSGCCYYCWWFRSFPISKFLFGNYKMVKYSLYMRHQPFVCLCFWILSLPIIEQFIGRSENMAMCVN
jgi:hypothetical protein